MENQDNIGASRFSAGLGIGTSASASQQKPLNMASFEEMLVTMRGIPPANWMLISPDGRVWKGVDPMVLAAQATMRAKKSNELCSPFANCG